MLQFNVVLDNAVVDDDNFTGAVQMWRRCLFGRAAVRGPARMADAVNTIKRSNSYRLFQVSQFAGRAADIQMAVFSNHSDSGGVIAAILKALQAVEDQRNNAFRPDITDNSAHGESLRGNSLPSKLRQAVIHLG